MIIYIFFPFYNNLRSFTIPMNYFIRSINKCLNDNSYNTKILTTSEQLFSTKLKLCDFLIMYQHDFIYSYRPNWIINNLDKYVSNIEKQIILIFSEEINIRPQMIKQTQHKSVHSIWDFSEKNLKLYKLHKINSIVLPNGYHPCLKWNSLSKKKNIDLYFYGNISSRRENIINPLKKKYNVLCGNFHEKEFINNVLRSRIILIIHGRNNESAVEFYRLSCLLSNNVFVIHEDVNEDYIETKKKFNEIIYCKYDLLVEKTEFYLKKTQEERDIISNNITNWWIKNHHIENYIPFYMFKK